MKKLYVAFLFIFCFLCFDAGFSYAAYAGRKHFLSHGPSVAAFGAGETVFSAYNYPDIIQYNPSLSALFKESGISLSRFNLLEESSYNSASIVFKVLNNYSLGLSVSNLSTGDIILRDTIYSDFNRASINKWNYTLSASGLINKFDIAYGLNIKYIYYDLYLNDGGTFAIDTGISKNFKGPKIAGNISKIKIGLSAQNFIAGDLKIESENDEIPAIYRISSGFSIPVYYRFKTQDILNIYADLKYEDDFLEFCGGVSYILANKYFLRGGYYNEHFTFGFGIEFYSFAFDYAADFSEIELINRFALSYRWGGEKTNDLIIEAKEALEKEKLNLKEAEKRFKSAKKLYYKGKYLRATDMLADIVISYPKFESPLHFYNKIAADMNIIADSKTELDFGKLTYAKGYNAYYKADYKEALNEWKKYNHFTGGNEEIAEYYNKISDALELEAKQKHEAELDAKALNMLQAGINSYNLKKWIKCIKEMEALQKFVSKNTFYKTLEYHTKAKEYINKSIRELSKTIKKEEYEEETVKKEEVIEIDEAGADKKYNEGLILYAQGRYFEAERMWELTLRLNPNHKKAKIALSKLRTGNYLAQ